MIILWGIFFCCYHHNTEAMLSHTPMHSNKPCNPTPTTILVPARATGICSPAACSFPTSPAAKGACTSCGCSPNPGPCCCCCGGWWAPGTGPWTGAPATLLPAKSASRRLMGAVVVSQSAIPRRTSAIKRRGGQFYRVAEFLVRTCVQEQSLFSSFFEGQKLQNHKPT